MTPLLVYNNMSENWKKNIEKLSKNKVYYTFSYPKNTFYFHTLLSNMAQKYSFQNFQYAFHSYWIKTISSQPWNNWAFKCAKTTKQKLIVSWELINLNITKHKHKCLSCRIQESNFPHTKPRNSSAAWIRLQPKTQNLNLATRVTKWYQKLVTLEACQIGH